MLLLVLPDQLFKNHIGLKKNLERVILLESPFYFDRDSKIKYHKQKLILHRASMRAYEDFLKKKGYKVEYLSYKKDMFSWLMNKEVGNHMILSDPVNDKLKKLIISEAKKNKIEIEFLESQNFINTRFENEEFRSSRNRWFMADFYKHQRRKLNILLEGGKPVGGKWSFDTENRKKIPKSERKNIPRINFSKITSYHKEAIDYVEREFPYSLGSSENIFFPVTFHETEKWLDDFLEHRFEKFGIYEDSLVPEQSWLYHSILTPMLNIGLITPNEIVERTLIFVEKKAKGKISIASLEGFLRQIIGWREFMRATYNDLGDHVRCQNHWNHNHKLPNQFYTGETGVTPIDDVIKRILNTGYCHHIERLMVLGGFMFLCEIHPNEIYHWFMSLFVDAYDWVMVPNVYCMSQNADGGLITTKPYFSGSSYLKKMGYDDLGDWCDLWDALYWRWIWKHKSTLNKNPRWSMMCRLAEKMDKHKMANHLNKANNYLLDFEQYINH